MDISALFRTEKGRLRPLFFGRKRKTQCLFQDVGCQDDILTGFRNLTANDGPSFPGSGIGPRPIQVSYGGQFFLPPFRALFEQHTSEVSERLKDDPVRVIEGIGGANRIPVQISEHLLAALQAEIDEKDHRDGLVSQVRILR